MLSIYLTDTQQHVQFNDYPSDQPVKFLLNLKKIFPSTADLLLPVLPEDNDLENVTWESTSKDFEVFKIIFIIIYRSISSPTRWYVDSIVIRRNERKRNAVAWHAVNS